MSEEKKYTRKELYLGYYWLILHTDPFHDPNGGFRDGGLIISSGYWETEMPACVKTAIGEHVTLLAKTYKELRLTSPLWQRIELPFEPNAEAQMASLQRIESLVSAIFNWFINKNILLLRVDNKEIMCWRDLRRLWKKATVIDSSGKSFFLTQLEGFKKCKLGEYFYDRDHDDILYALKSYLEPQHKKNLEMLETQAGKKDTEPPSYTYNWRFDKARREVSCSGGTSVKLEPSLFNLFSYLHDTKPNSLITKKAIKNKFKITEAQAKNRINKLISFLNKKHAALGLKDGKISKIIERVPDKKDHRKSKGIIFHQT